MALATRAELRPKIAASYSFARHVVLLHIFALGAIAGALSQLRGLQPIELVAVPATFLFANAVEYLFHRFPMHHLWPGLGFLFSRHTVHHHAYFRADAMLVGDSRDMRFVLFPVFAGLLVIALTAVGGALLYATVSWNAGLLFLATATLYYLVYEWFHASFHLASVEQLARIPLVGRAARRHRLHHEPARMTEVNYSITFALFDRLLGTIDRS
ncbi:MAG: sterol desaturase family protein [Planctomycetota bacterium]